ncbi:tetratricopeptide repeat protein [Candidatus Poribacteria bacterium]|nr:tetratricopeptide repeat protein [Candidatus Poribacteria bacterium]
MNEIRDGHYTLGNAYLREGQYDEAVEHFELAISLDSNFIEAYHALAITYLQQQRLQDAKDAAREALRIDITYQPILSFLQAIEPSIPTTPQVVVPTEQTDVIEKPIEKEDIPKQEETPKQPNPTIPPEKEKAPTIADDIDIDTELERGIIFLANKQYQQAEAAFKKVLKSSPNHAIAHYNLAQSHMETGVLTDAKIQVDKAYGSTHHTNPYNNF